MTPLPPICGWAPYKNAIMAKFWETARGPLLRPPAKFLQSYGLPTQPSIDAVNRVVNRQVRYKAEPAGSNDWQTAEFTFTRKTGDCEDFALLKHRLLRAQGMPDERLILLVLFDAVQKLDHAMLLVDDGTVWLSLDQRTDTIIPVSKMSDYRPIIGYQNAATYTFPGPRRVI